MTETSFEQALRWSGGSWGVTLNAGIAQEMIDLCRPRIPEGYKPARDFALLACLPLASTLKEENGYKDFLDRYFQRGAKVARKKKKVKENHRPFAPLDAYKDDIR